MRLQSRLRFQDIKDKILDSKLSVTIAGARAHDVNCAHASFLQTCALGHEVRSKWKRAIFNHEKPARFPRTGLKSK